MNKTKNGKVFKITQEQYNRALEEGINIAEEKINIESGGGGTVQFDDKGNGETEISATSVDANNPVKFTTDQNSSMSESRLISKKDFLAERRKRLKESSEVISVSSLLK